MLVLSRKPGEKLHIEGGITVTVLEVHGGRVKLGVEAPGPVTVRRSELPALPGAARIQGQSGAAAP
jgi:carbon storage regulator